MDKIKPLFTATATAIGGATATPNPTTHGQRRSVGAQGDGGPASRTRDAGASVRRGLCRLLRRRARLHRKQAKKNAANAKITARCDRPRDGGASDCREAARRDNSLPQAELAALVKQATSRSVRTRTPTRNNVDVQLEVVGA